MCVGRYKSEHLVSVLQLVFCDKPQLQLEDGCVPLQKFILSLMMSKGLGQEIGCHYFRQDMTCIKILDIVFIERATQLCDNVSYYIVNIVCLYEED